MIFNTEEYELNGKKVLLRSAKEDEAEARMLIDYLKTVSRETDFLLCYPDEIKYTMEQEMAFIKDANEAKGKMLILAFVDGEYAGNCSFNRPAPGRRADHRVDVGIALFERYTGAGLGRLMMKRLLEKAKEEGFEQAELTVVEGNDRALHLYKSLGFKECGRIPNANRYDDGTYSDDIRMIIQF